LASTHSSARPFAALSLAAVLGAGLVLLPALPASAAVPGAQSSGDELFRNQGNTGYAVDHYEIDLEYLPGGSITAVATIQATVTGENLSSFSLDLEGLDVTSVTVDGVAASFTRVDGPATDPVAAHKLVITPAAEVSGDFEVVVDYRGTPTSHTDPDESSEGWIATLDGATAVNEPVGAMTWYPVNNTPTDKATYDIALTVPTGLEAVSNGVLASTTDNSNGTTTWLWQQTGQMAPFLSMVSIGQYTVYRWDIERSDGSTLPVWDFVDPTLDSDEVTALRELQEDIILWGEDRFGPYPGTAAGVLIDDVGVGYALETQDRSFFDGGIDESTLVHEIVHQWLGNEVSPTQWNDLWQSEGPASFYEAVWAAERDPEAPTSEDVFYDAWSGRAETSAFWQTPPANLGDPANLFSSPVYTRGAMTLENLRIVIGDDDFEAFTRALLDEYADGDVSTAQIVALASEVSGRDLDAFFSAWLLEPGKPAWQATDISVTTDAETVETGGSATLTLTATNNGLMDTFGAILELDVTDLDGAVEFGELPEGVVLDGGSLVWETGPIEAGAAASVDVAFTVAEDAAGTLDATLTSADDGVYCGDACAVSIAIDEEAGGIIVTPLPPSDAPTDDDQDTSDGPVAAPSGSDDDALANTGTDSAPLALGALAVLLSGAALLAVERFRRRLNA
jgi:hypothetical protein